MAAGMSRALQKRSRALVNKPAVTDQPIHGNAGTSLAPPVKPPVTFKYVHLCLLYGHTRGSICRLFQQQMTWILETAQEDTINV